MQSSYIRHGYLTVPRNFAAAHLPCNCKSQQSIILRSPPQKQEWQISFWTNGINKIFRRNMKRFFLDNNSKEGDLCLFELVKSREVLAMTGCSLLKTVMEEPMRSETYPCMHFQLVTRTIRVLWQLKGLDLCEMIPSYVGGFLLLEEHCAVHVTLPLWQCRCLPINYISQIMGAIFI